MNNYIKKTFTIIFTLFLFSTVMLCQNNSYHKLWYEKPANRWTEALPVGNGSLGGMVFGRVDSERVQLNDDTFWTGKQYDPNNPEALPNLPKVRELIKTGKYQEAMDLANQKLMGNPVDLMKYQPLGDLRIFFDDHKEFKNYKRELDVEHAVVKISYETNGINYTREIFASYPDQVLVYRFTATNPAQFHSKQL